MQKGQSTEKQLHSQVLVQGQLTVETCIESALQWQTAFRPPGISFRAVFCMILLRMSWLLCSDQAEQTAALVEVTIFGVVLCKYFKARFPGVCLQSFYIELFRQCSAHFTLLAALLNCQPFTHQNYWHYYTYNTHGNQIKLPLFLCSVF